MKIVIIGANGQLGSDLCLALKEHEIIPLLHEDIEITQSDSVKSRLDKIRPEVIINTAALHDLSICEKEPEQAFLVNGIGPRNLALWCKENDCALMHISTDYVFGGEKDSPYVETDAVSPLNSYGITKLCGELFVTSILDKHVIIRTSGLFGTHPCRGKKSKNFIEMFLGLIEGKDIVEFGGKEISTPTFTQDLSEQIRIILEKKLYGIFHVTNEGQSSWFGIGEYIISQTRSNTKLVERTGREPAGILRPHYTVLENESLKKNGINIMQDWKGAIDKYLVERNK